MKKIAVISAHPDDEAFGCGGTLLKHKSKGDELSLLFMTDGISARKDASSKETSKRESDLRTAMACLNPKHFERLNFPDNKLDSVPLLDIVQEIETFLQKVKPDIIYTHFWNDLNIDHSLTAKATLTATRPGSPTSVKKILAYEVPSSTEWQIEDEPFRPNYFVGIENQIDSKIELINCYETEVRPYPHPRSIENIKALGQVRGATVSIPYAEGFILVRSIDDEK
ncbi:MAG: PIG-L family deacetylase [Alphaproteobacteria bacterium]|jgi:N-acetylglucosamine malate deacetylase 1|nr:PIG-L family deacetylase [Alphaproteobacteria bacterium]MBT5389771.1 PIG-L family deacetylase [Alphaproteobacteria bacterium]MBT5540865.1 PIG-L family deacetylase [Alphaproteobacteria bacterium]MBT5654525.1 PIG-L family deacetylase [Alphaproteobacteria bacterium]